MLTPLRELIVEELNKRFKEIEEEFNSDMVFICGPIQEGLEGLFLHLIEDISYNDKKEKLIIMLTTTGGSVVVVERLVNIARHHYKEVNFIVPDYAYSAGTIFCMSGDNIYMDYYSVLGPIDPQVMNKDGKFVAALGYLDKVNELIKKSQDQTLTQAEFLLLQNMDLAELRSFEQARDLTIDLLQKWLVKYKFKNWNTHSNSGKSVTDDEKRDKAIEIASILNDHSRWKSHGRPINIDVLREIGLQIEDYSKNKKQSEMIREYYNCAREYMNDYNIVSFIHTRRFI